MGGLRAETALQRFGAPVSVIAGLQTARGLDVVWMGHPPARIDLMKAVPGGDFDAAWATRTTFDVEGTAVVVVGHDELIRLERASGRAQDLLDADKLTLSSDGD